MIIKNYQLNLQVTIILATIFTLLVIALIPAPVQADLPPRPGLPPRPTRPASPSKDSDSGSDKIIGGYIALEIQAAPVGVWTVVQWQDQTGGWHDVEGWQGTLDEKSQKVWTVQPADFCKGPFRWVVYQGKNGSLWISSSSFYLPHTAYEIVSEKIILPASVPIQPIAPPSPLPEAIVVTGLPAASSTLRFCQ